MVPYDFWPTQVFQWAKFRVGIMVGVEGGFNPLKNLGELKVRRYKYCFSYLKLSDIQWNLGSRTSRFPYNSVPERKFRWKNVSVYAQIFGSRTKILPPPRKKTKAKQTPHKVGAWKHYCRAERESFVNSIIAKEFLQSFNKKCTHRGKRIGFLVFQVGDDCYLRDLLNKAN